MRSLLYPYRMIHISSIISALPVR